MPKINLEEIVAPCGIFLRSLETMEISESCMYEKQRKLYVRETAKAVCTRNRESCMYEKPRKRLDQAISLIIKFVPFLIIAERGVNFYG
jgi:hypothetical protein